MANKLFPKFREALLSAGVNLATGTVKAVLVDTGAYTQSDTHEFLTSVPSGARIGTAQTLASKTTTLGAFDAADVVFTGVPAGSGSASAVEALVIYVDTGTEATSRLIAYIDTATGLPAALTGANVTITWDATFIFSI